MINFEWPWLAILIPLPLLVRYLLKPVQIIQEAALRVPFISDFEQANPTIGKRQFRQILLWLAMIAWILFVGACMRPQWLDDFVEIPVSGRDLMLAVDLSGSMEERDFFINGKKVDRLTATKWVAGNFIERRIGDRLGLILFGEQAYLQTPLTFDRETIKTLLLESVIGLAGQSTAIGDAIGLAVKRLREQEKQSRVLILLTDGANTAGTVKPIAAAELAAREDLKIYTIGIGADEMIIRSIFGSRKVNPSSELDEETLRAIAEQTGGRYFRARDTEELEQIYILLDELEPIEKDVQRFRPQTTLYFWPLCISFILFLFVLFMRYRSGVT
ncbi:MAG: VWA domain-containing protein [Pseudomonadota bacterium]